MGVRLLPVALPLTALVLAASPPAASAECIEAITVNGRMLVGQADASGDLPPRAGGVDVVVPACNDAGQGDPDARDVASRLRGVPPDVAVIHRGRVFVAPGTMGAVAGHPLGSRQRTPPRGRCGRSETLRGVAAYDAEPVRMLLTVSGRERRLHLDGRTRVANRPPHQPVLRGQRLAVRTSACGGRRYADRIAFVGANQRPERSVPDFDRAPRDLAGGTPWWLIGILAVPAVFVAGLALGLRR